MPLLQERYDCLRESGRVLCEVRHLYRELSAFHSRI